MNSPTEPMDSHMDTPLSTPTKDRLKTFDMSVKEAALAIGKYDKFIVRLIQKGKLPYQEITNERNLKEYRLNSADIGHLKGQAVGQRHSPTSASKEAADEPSGHQISKSSPTNNKRQSDMSDISLIKYFKGRVTELERRQSDNIEHNPLVDRLKLETEDLKERLKSKEDTLSGYIGDQQKMSGQIGYFQGQAEILRQEVLILREEKPEEESEKSEGTVDQDSKETSSPTEVRQSRTRFLERIFGALKQNPNSQ